MNSLRIFLIFIGFLYSSLLLGQDEDPDLYKVRVTFFTKEKFLKDACARGEIANCYMLGRHYLEKAPAKKFKEKIIDPKTGDEGFIVLTGEKKGKKLITNACSKGHADSCIYLKGGILAGEGSDYIFYSALGLLFISILIVASLMFMEEEEFKASEKIEEGADSNKNLAQHGVILRYSRPFFKRYFTPIVSQMKNKKKIKEKYKRPLSTAGKTEILTPEDLFSFKLFLIIGFPIVFLGVRAFLEETWPINMVFVLGFVGFFYPDLWLRGQAQTRQKEIISNMPFAVDLLALSVEAGLDFVAAMAKVVEKAKPSALTWEFEQMMKEIKIGASRAEALRNMAWRIDVIQISSFCATLIAADSVGASIGPILKNLSAEIRQKRSSDVEKAGATAATKILFPMLFLIVPAVFIIVAAPIMLEMFMGGKK